MRTSVTSKSCPGEPDFLAKYKSDMAIRKAHAGHALLRAKRTGPDSGYRLGNRSALEWVIDQYRVTRDEKGNIANDPNRPDDERYIVRLIGQVITVSLETQKLVSALPEVQAGDPRSRPTRDGMVISEK